MSDQKPILLTGIRASGDIHLGNYLGAMRGAIERQTQYRSYFFVADYHALTSTPPADELQTNIKKVASAWLAIGLDPKKTIFWRQSDVVEHLELAYLLTCVTSMGLLERAHTYKDAIEKSKTLRAGLFYYPLLMAADILLYQADLVPVGKDQAQHLEMARDMATFFNEQYKSELKLPRGIITEDVGTIPGTDGRKMSKSYSNGIDLFATESVLKKQIMSIKTDSKGLEDSKNPDECIVYQLYKLIAPSADAELMKQKLIAGGYGYGDAKKALLGCILDQFNTMRQEYDRWMKNPGELNDILKAGALKAKEEASPFIYQLRRVVGL